MDKSEDLSRLSACLIRIALYFLQTNQDFSGATASNDGKKGMVPEPQAGDNVKFLKGDGTWANPTLAEVVVGNTQPTVHNAIWLKTS